MNQNQESISVNNEGSAELTDGQKAILRVAHWLIDNPGKIPIRGDFNEALLTARRGIADTEDDLKRDLDKTAEKSFKEEVSNILNR